MNSITKHRHWGDRAFWPLVVVLLLFLAARQIDALIQESETIDEGVHLVAGYSAWKTQDFRLTPTHPPLAHLVSSFPLLFLKADFSPSPEAWNQADDYAIAKQFLYDNRVHADTLLRAGRMTTVLVTLFLGAVLAYWSRKRFGAAAGLFTLLLFSLSPTVIAHGHFITTDMMVTAFLACACLSFLDYLETGTTRHLVQIGVLIGLTFASKFNGLILYPILLLIYLAHRWKHPGKLGWHHSLKPTLCALVLLPWMIVYATYFFETRSLSQDPRLKETLQSRQGITAVVAKIPVPAYYYFRGMQLLIRDFVAGHDNYLLGKAIKRGSWLYFPVAFAVKTPVSSLILMLLCVMLLASRLTARSSIPFHLVALSIPPVVYFLASLTSSLNIGIRHLLPMYPFLFMVVAATIFGTVANWDRRFAQIQATVLAGLLVIESISIHPNYLAFFNGLAGGPANGPSYLIDSNLDWGQDLKKLKEWSDRSGGSTLCLSYFGHANPQYYGISYEPLESLRDRDEVLNSNCIVAVSAHILYGGAGERFRALHSFVPDERIGYSIYIYDFRKNHRAAGSPQMPIAFQSLVAKRQ